MLLDLKSRSKYFPYIVALLLLLPFVGTAQYFNFSEEPDEFVNDITAGISAIDNESAQKVAYDFRNSWSSGFSAEQKEIIIRTAVKMRKKRLQTRPFFQYYFSMVTYAVTQAQIDDENFTNVLKISESAVENYNQKKLEIYLRTISTFFARGFLYKSKFDALKYEGGSYSFELLDAPKGFIEQREEDLHISEEGEEEVLVDEPIQEDELPPATDESFDDGGGDDWGDDDGWGDDDDWGDDDGWGSDGDDDGWGNDSDDSWNAQDDFQEPPIPAYKRPEVDKIIIDHVSEYQADDIAPTLEGAVIKLKNVDLILATHSDTIVIKNTSGSYMIGKHTFVGEGGVYDWPDQLEGTDGAEVVMDKYHFNASLGYIKTTKAKLLFPKMFEDSLDGAFIFKSVRRSNNRNRRYPYFISNYSKTAVKLPYEGVTYKGGFSLVGDKMYGTSISKHPSVLSVDVSDGRNFRAEAVKFAFEDSTILAHLAYNVIYHNQDSIVHPGVEFDYDAGKEKLTLFRHDGHYRHTFYYSSYFKMEMKADLLVWDTNSDSLDISIMNGRNIVPAVFQSEDYFNPISYEKMTGLFGFHPVSMVVFYARKIKSSEYNISELIYAYKDVTPRRIHEAVTYLKRDQMIEYNAQNGDIKVLRKAYHSIMSNDKKKDFDNILISSLSPGAPNATFNLETEEFTVRGVRKIFLTPDLKNAISPEEGNVTLLKNKDMKFNGAVHSGGFKYVGREFDFSYSDFLINMPTIDSIRIEVEPHDSLKTDDHHAKVALHNQITETSGVLYLSHPKNKSGLKTLAKYPYFVSDSEAVVYFDSPEILDGAYDRTVKFLIPPFEVDSTGRDDLTGVGFEGVFDGGDIFPEFKEKLEIMPDQSLGFVHQIPAQGYALYGGEGTVYGEITLDYNGLRVNGKIDYRTTTVNSDEFIYYMDSVSAVGDKGVIREGNYKGASYPEAVLGAYKMKWLPKKDSMYIANIQDSFDFYNATASLDGEANITAKGVFGSGVMLSRGSRSESDEFEFAQYKYSARHAKFEILTDVPEKPAMAGDDISMNFDLVKNIADVHPEQEGVAAISFPYGQMKTSITNATWYLDQAKITMTKPPEVDIHSSYFYTTREELDSLAFNATDAIYDINTYELNVKGIPYIIVADAEIIPDGNETTILENSELQQFENAQLKIDTLNEYHYLSQGNIKILSRNEFEGNALYEVTTEALDTFFIKFASFELRDIPTGRRDETIKMTVSGGTVPEEDKLQVAPGFLYKGEATMYANKKSLELSGLIKLNLQSVKNYNYWIEYYTSGDTTDLVLDVATALTEEGLPIEAGISYEFTNNKIYPTFVDYKTNPEDEFLFKADGLVTHDYKRNTYKIEPAVKSADQSYEGQTMIYDDNTGNIIFEGELSFIKNTEDFSLTSSGLGVAKPDSGMYVIDALLMLNINMHSALVDEFTNDVLDIIERLGADVAYDNSIELIYKLSDVIGDRAAKNYEDNSLQGYEPLVNASPLLNTTLVLPKVELNWSPAERAWYNTQNSGLGISNIGRTDVNAAMGGFIEIQKNEYGGDVVNLFLQVAETTWYHFTYDDKRMFINSSNQDFNDELVKRAASAKAGQFSIAAGDYEETLKWINRFRKNYYKISDSYNLEFQEEQILEDEETFDTFEEVDEEEEVEPTEEEDDDDDGF